MAETIRPLCYCNAHDGAHIHLPAMAHERLEVVLREEIALLRAWARESREGGWSTHQVQPMLDRASALALIVCGEPAGPPPASAPPAPPTDSRRSR